MANFGTNLNRDYTQSEVLQQINPTNQSKIPFTPSNQWNVINQNNQQLPIKLPTFTPNSNIWVWNIAPKPTTNTLIPIPKETPKVENQTQQPQTTLGSNIAFWWDLDQYITDDDKRKLWQMINEKYPTITKQEKIDKYMQLKEQIATKRMQAKTNETISPINNEPKWIMQQAYEQWIQDIQKSSNPIVNNPLTRWLFTFWATPFIWAEQATKWLMWLWDKVAEYFWDEWRKALWKTPLKESEKNQIIWTLALQWKNKTIVQNMADIALWNITAWFSVLAPWLTIWLDVWWETPWLKQWLEWVWQIQDYIWAVVQQFIPWIENLTKEQQQQIRSQVWGYIFLKWLTKSLWIWMPKWIKKVEEITNDYKSQVWENIKPILWKIDNLINQWRWTINKIWQPINKLWQNIVEPIKKTWKDINDRYQSLVNPDIETLIQRAIKPRSTIDKQTFEWKKKFNENVVKWFSAIIYNKWNLEYTLPDWEIETWRLPKTVGEASEALHKTQQDLYKTYTDELKNKWKNITIDVTPVIKDLNHLAKDKWIQLTSPQTINYINQTIETIQNWKNIEPMELQNIKQRLNNELKTYYRNPDPNTAGKTIVNELLNNKIWKILEDSIWPEYSYYKKLYWSLRNIQTDIIHRANIQWNKNAFQMLDIANIFNVADALKAFWNIKKIPEAGFKLWATTIAKKMNNPDYNMKKLFEKLNERVEEEQRNFKEPWQEITPTTWIWPKWPTEPNPQIWWQPNNLIEIKKWLPLIEWKSWNEIKPNIVLPEIKDFWTANEKTNLRQLEELKTEIPTKKNKKENLPTKKETINKSTIEQLTTEPWKLQTKTENIPQKETNKIETKKTNEQKPILDKKQINKQQLSQKQEIKLEQKENKIDLNKNNLPNDIKNKIWEKIWQDLKNNDNYTIIQKLINHIKSNEKWNFKEKLDNYLKDLWYDWIIKYKNIKELPKETINKWVKEVKKWLEWLKLKNEKTSEQIPLKQENKDWFKINKDLIPLKLAQNAHRWTSFSSESRWEYEVKDFENVVNDTYNNLLKYAKTDKQKQLLNEEMEKFQTKYAELKKWQLISRSNIVSPMITWPARFPVARMEKLNNYYMNKVNATLEWKEKAIGWIKKKLNWLNVEEQWWEYQMLKNEIEIMQKKQEMMKQWNKILKSKLTNEEKINKLKEILPNSSDENIKEIVNDWWFKSFELTNLNNKIKDRIKKLETMNKKEQLKEKAKTEWLKEHIFDWWKVIENVELDRLQIHFDWMPNKETIEKLKSNWFKRSPTNKTRQRQLTNNAIWTAKKIWFIK